MLLEAIAKAREGRAVYVVAANESEARRMRNLLGPEGQLLGIKVETSSELTNLDWFSMRLKGAHPKCIVLADHFAIELHFAPILNMLHRYDNE